jgi:ribosomal protein S18 acetylase RimI-like enzyme
MTIRDAAQNDLPWLLRLYAQFGKDAMAEDDGRADAIWRAILADKNHHVIVAAAEEAVVSSCVLVIVPNLTHGGRPYGLIENVITDERHRRQGLGLAVMRFAAELAVRENCYKLMLMTGSKQDGTLRFYEQAGYNRTDKTAFVRWL